MRGSDERVWLEVLSSDEWEKTALEWPVALERIAEGMRCAVILEGIAETLRPWTLDMEER